MRNYIYSTCIGLLLSFTASATEFFNGTYDEAIQKAKQENKKILLYFTAKWCSPCRKMDKTVYPSDSITQLLAQKYIALKANVDSYAGGQLEKKYTIVAYPTFLILDQEANVISRKTGFLSVKNMYGFLTSMDNNVELPQATLSDNEIKRLEYNKKTVRPFKHAFGVLTGINLSAFTNNPGNGRIGSQFLVFVNMQNNNVYGGRFLIRPGIGYLSKGNKSNVGHFLNIPIDFGYTFLRSAIAGIPARARVVGSPYYSFLLNKSTGFNRSDTGFRSGFSIYLGDRSRGASEFELLLLYELGMTDALASEAGTQRNQVVSVSFGLTF